MDELITRYEFKIVEPGCSPGSGRYGLQVDVPNDISPVFPYLNALLESSKYDHQNCILIWMEKDRAYALRPHEIRISYGKGIEDLTQSSQIVSEIVDRVNQAWRNRENITPYLSEKGRPNVIDIFKLLPRTNCKKCGYTTCLVFAADLSEGKVQIERCSALHIPERAASRQKLQDILAEKPTNRT